MRYELSNPVIGGEIPKNYDGDNASDAAKKVWERLSESKLIMNNLPVFAFTLKDNADKLYHFIVKEKPTDRMAEYTIEDVTDTVNKEMTPEVKKEFLKASHSVSKRLEKGQMGGRPRRYRDDSSDDDLDDVDDYLRYIRQKSYTSPLYYWWFAPSLYNIRSVFTPIFTPSVTPYVHLWVPSH
jgi:hypothetical protein